MLPRRYYRDQAIALGLTLVAWAVLVGLIYLEISLINRVIASKISLSVQWTSVAIGFGIYIKTAVDFALFIGRLMHKNSGLKSRIAIELGTAAGNGLGTAAILLVWAFFRQINWLLAIMVILAGLVLMRLAQDGLEHSSARDGRLGQLINGFCRLLRRVNGWFGPLLDRIIPAGSLVVSRRASFLGLFALAFTVPLILGLDDFAGYVPLFSLINLFGFAIGATAGHMLLNALLFLSPERTTKVVANRMISLLGALIFVGLAAFSFVEGFRLLLWHSV